MVLNPTSHSRIKPKEELSKSVLNNEGNKQTVELINPKTKTKEFAGTLLNGKKHGTGVEYWPNGNVRYEGQYLNDKNDGKNVTFYHPNGNGMFKGSVKEGVLEGMGELFHPNGT